MFRGGDAGRPLIGGVGGRTRVPRLLQDIEAVQRLVCDDRLARELGEISERTRGSKGSGGADRPVPQSGVTGVDDWP